jgi:hypothetical protein
LRNEKETGDLSDFPEFIECMGYHEDRRITSIGALRRWRLDLQNTWLDATYQSLENDAKKAPVGIATGAFVCKKTYRTDA